MDSNTVLPQMNRRQFLATGAAGLAADALARGIPAGGNAAASDPTRIIIDTDPGVDDALALLLAMRSPEVSIEAITPVAGNVPLDLTLPNALRMVEVAGRTSIPVAPGARGPLVRHLVTATYAHGRNGLNGAVFPTPTTQPSRLNAPEMIRQVVTRYPHQVTIVGIGPLTNVATALRAYPDLASLIPRIVIMGGSLSGGNITPAAEFNVYVDPEAAQIVFQAGIPMVMVGLDVTRKAILTEKYVQRLEAGHDAISRAAAQIARKTLEHDRREARRLGATLHNPPAAGEIPGCAGAIENCVGAMMHDPLAVAEVIRPGLLELRDYHVEVELSGELTAGETVGYSQAPIRRASQNVAAAGSSPDISDRYVPNVKVAVDVSPDRFFELFIPRLAGETGS
jgi:inosine-uridine nucleoside N-ribohydrolase